MSSTPGTQQASLPSSLILCRRGPCPSLWVGCCLAAMAAEWGGLAASSWTRATSAVQQMTAGSGPQLMQLGLVLLSCCPPAMPSQRFALRSAGHALCGQQTALHGGEGADSGCDDTLLKICGAWARIGMTVSLPVCHSGLKPLLQGMRSGDFWGKVKAVG